MATWVLGEFQTPQALLGAAAELRDQQVGELDTYSPYPLHGASEALQLKPSRIRPIALVAALCGCVGGYLMQWWPNAVDWPINVGNRPAHSPPSFVPISFEVMVLCAAVSIVVGLFVLAGLPRPHHPVFEVESFRSASIDKFWVSVCCADGTKQEAIQGELRRLGAGQVSVVRDEP